MRFAVVAFLDGQPIGASFEPGELPLHVTLLPPAATAASQGELEAAIESVLAGFGVLEAEGGDDELLGPARDIEVTLVEDDGSLAELHRELLVALRPLGVLVANPEYLGAGFHPHVTIGEAGDERIERGERIELDAVALLTRGDGPWELTAQFPLL